MRICFNVHGVGLANNGGSRTLIRCVETLCDLGYEAFFWSGKHHYTWHKTDIKCIGGKVHPKCDVSIATGINSYKSTAAFTGGKRVGFMRGLELWKTNEKKLLTAFRSLDHIFCNSEWQQQYLKNHGIRNVTRQYPGLDTDTFRNLKQDREGVASLMHNKHPTKRSCDAVDVSKVLGLTFKYLNRDIKRPTGPELNEWYNQFKVWLAPTELEGLHNPPMEAGLAGCALVCTDHPRSGMSDFAHHDSTALLYHARDIKAAVKHIETLLANEDKREELSRNLTNLLWTKIGPRAACMEQFAERLAIV